LSQLSWFLVALAAEAYLAWRWAQWALSKGYRLGVANGSSTASSFTVISTAYVILRRISEDDKLSEEERAAALGSVKDALTDGTTAQAWLKTPMEDMAVYVTEKLGI
jgi:hypothetical protein